MIKAILLKPLDGDPEGSKRDFEKVDFDRLEAMGAVRKADAKSDATEQGAADAEAEQAIADHTVPFEDETKVEAKTAPEPLNKMAPEPQNKAAKATRKKSEG